MWDLFVGVFAPTDYCVIPSYLELDAYGRVMQTTITPFEAEVIRDLAKVWITVKKNKAGTPQGFRPVSGTSSIRQLIQPRAKAGSSGRARRVVAK